MVEADTRLNDRVSAVRSPFSGRRVLVTGHTGFKGAWLAFWLLRQGAEVTGFSLAPPTQPNLFGVLKLENHMRHIEEDIRDIAAVQTAWREVRPELVFHLAAQSLVRESYRAPLTTIATNVLGTAHVLEVARTCRFPVGLLVVTSDKCYENREILRAYTESDRLGGHDVYSMSKGAAELVISSYRKSFFSGLGDDAAEVTVASARAGNVIGGGDWAPERLVPDCVRALESQQKIILRNPNAVRPWQHVLEPLSGYLKLGAMLLSSDASDRAKASDAWNFGPADANTSSVSQLVDSVLRTWGSGGWIHDSSSGAPHEASMLRLSIIKAEEELDWHPKWNLQRTVAHTVHWYRAFYGGDDMESWCGKQIDEHSNEVSEWLP